MYLFLVYNLAREMRVNGVPQNDIDLAVVSWLFPYLLIATVLFLIWLIMPGLFEYLWEEFR
jgi:hypothetical protein